jgi:hypothetical protein
MVVPPSTEEVAEAAERVARQVVAEATTGPGKNATAFPIEVRALAGNPAQVRLEQDADATCSRWATETSAASQAPG